MGKNESGKTAFLQALFRLNPVEPAAYNEVLDFPSRLTRQRKETDGPIPVCTAEFELTDAEISTIEDELGVGCLPSATFQVWRGYRSKSLTFSDLKINEEMLVHHFASNLDLAVEAGADVRSAGSVRDLIDALAALSEPTAKATELLDWMQSWRDQRAALHLIDTYLEPWIPKFVFFDEYSTMPGKVSVPALIEGAGQWRNTTTVRGGLLRPLGARAGATRGLQR